jgi:RNA-directed DNA polymerase
MTVEPQATGAVSHKSDEWHTINWEKAHREVRRLQARIVKATQEGRWGKVKALQRLLTRSYSAKVLAVKRVTENAGRKTPGVDGEIWDTPVKKMKAVHCLQQRGYRPQPLRRIYIPKDETRKKMRPLSIPTMKDRAMQALYLITLEPVAETTADPNSYGFRKGRACADAIEQCFASLAGKRHAEWILDADIKGCFEHISHEWLMEHIPLEKPILHKWLKAGYMEKSMLHPTDEGTPQGGIISPVLMNMTLDGLEKQLRAHYPCWPVRGVNHKVNLVRYADDFIITGVTRELLEQEIRPLVEQFLSERGLSLSPEKTNIVHIEEGFDFLGQNVRKYKGKLIIKPAKKNVKRFLKKVRTIIKSNPTVKTGRLIDKLNPVIRGWTQYHRHVVSAKTFQTVDRQIHQALWRWAKRRHSNKGSRWVMDKYFPQVAGCKKRVFRGECYGKTVTLFAAHKMPIKRHVGIRSVANPFDPDWEIYFEKRLDVKMEQNLRGRRQLLYLWREQNGICPICKRKITRLTGWHNHHIVWRSKGGPDKAENRVLLHPNCHRLVHSQSIYVEKPRPARQGVRAA